MPSSAKQILVVASKKKGNTKGTIAVIKNTGYLNLYINGVHYFYNNAKSYSPNIQNIYYKAVDAATQQANKTTKKTIVIRRIG